LVEVTADCGWKLRDAGLIAVVRGPGSFTGLRVGVTAAKAIAWTVGARLLGVSGFEIVAARTARALGREAEQVAVAFDAGRGDVFTAVVAPDRDSPTGWRVGPAALQPGDAWLAAQEAGVIVSGPALDLLADKLKDGRLLVADRDAWFPSAAEAATIAALRAEAGAADDPHALVPEYSRPSYAEEKPSA
jgi:tRNA threonylcarbamoyladenosine biosynthesis protein TsaB